MNMTNSNHVAALIRLAAGSVFPFIPLAFIWAPYVTAAERIYFFTGVLWSVLVALVGVVVALTWTGRLR